MAGFEFTFEAIVRSFDWMLEYIGTDWFQENAASFESKPPAEKLARYSYLYDQPAHPLIRWYSLFPAWKMECEQRGVISLSEPIVNLALLGQSLQKISGDKKFAKLITRLKDPEQFYATAWEIEVAASHIAQGLRVEFIEERDTPSPDLRVTDTFGNSFWIECKNRDVSNDKQSGDVWKQVERRLLQYLEKNRLNYQIALSMGEMLKPNYASYITNFVIECIERKFEPKSLLRLPGASFKSNDETEKIELEIHKLSEPDIELDGHTLTLPCPRDQADFGTFSCKRTDLDDGRAIISNPRAVHFRYANSARVEGVESAFKSAVRQLPKSGPGVIHIRLPINSWVTDFHETKTQVENYLRKELSGKDNRRVNAVVVKIYYSELMQKGVFQYPIYRHCDIVVKHRNPLR